ncbi:MAG: hypothetical protein EOM91_11965 [Sphingobacteriia bacterium]|nr:hypothetical protein [Sphingobacteriia bacterium]NCC39375.1 hypothetical protein [Gammaproteobacteria bacterium]
MQELTERSRALRDDILRNQALLRDLSERIAQILKGQVKLPENTLYLFVPKVYRRPVFLPEVYMTAIDPDLFPWPQPFPGPLDPWIVHILEKERLPIADNQVDPTPQPATPLQTQILSQPALFVALSEGIAEVLARHGVNLAADETYGFEAMTMPRPTFRGEAQSPTLALASQAHGQARRLAWEQMRIPRWFEGIPKPELLAELDRMRLPTRR